MDSGSFAGHRFIFFEADVVAAFTTDAACTHGNERCQGQSKWVPGATATWTDAKTVRFAVEGSCGSPAEFLYNPRRESQGQDDGQAILHCSAGQRQRGHYNVQ